MMNLQEGKVLDESQNSPKRNIIALDYGRRRVGIAGCGGEVPIAFGITTLTVRGFADLITQLDPILKERTATEVVLGFPLTLGDKPGTLKYEILKLFTHLQDFGLKVHLVDEALSSRRATRLLQERGRRAKKEDCDRTSAALILQEFLDGRLPPLTPAEIERIQTDNTQKPDV